MVSVPEAICLVEELWAKEPADRCERFMDFCERTIQQIERCLPEHATPDDPGDVSASELSKFSDWYANSALSCPFLHEDSCEIYSYRPVMCRECFVIGSASQCQIGKTSAVVKTIQGPVRFRDVLMRLASEFTHGHREGILMHSVFSWYERNERIRNQKWPAELLVERFAAIVRSSIPARSIRERPARRKVLSTKSVTVR
jgi:Fe-S-cluster containining protein